MTQKTSITVNHQELAKWRVVKAEVERDSGHSLSWEQFLDVVISSFRQLDQVPVATMAQDLDEAEQLEPDDEFTLKVAAMTGSRAILSEVTCELIAEMVADKLIDKLRMLDSAKSEVESED